MMRWILLITLLAFVVCLIATVGMLVTVAIGIGAVGVEQLGASAALTLVLYWVSNLVSRAC